MKAARSYARTNLARRVAALEASRSVGATHRDMSLLTAGERGFLCDLARRDLAFLEGDGAPISAVDLAHASAIDVRISVPVKSRAKAQTAEIAK